MAKEERKMLEHGPLEFMVGRLFDILIIPKVVSGSVRRVTIIYEENGRVSSFEYDVRDPKYGNDRKRMIDAAIRGVINEVKSRKLAGHTFTTWFLENYGMRWTIKETRRIGKAVPALRRYAPLVEESAKLVYDEFPSKDQAQ